ncbi:hypothetical protein DTO212C5_7642 [Paecilomyces variotii]|nr:hypothetical protein DTO212C5_7642 [Paecilomyces variotii]
MDTTYATSTIGAERKSPVMVVIFRPHGPLSIPLIVGEGKTPFPKHQLKEWFESAVLRGNSASLRVLLGQIAQISVREAMLYLIAIASTGPRKRTFKN